MMKILLLKKKFESGQLIFKAGDPGTEAYLIRDGYVSIWTQEGSNKVELATRGPGEIIGEMALMDDKPRSANVTAKSPVEMEIITRNDLKSMLSNVPEPLAVIINQLLVRLRDTNELAAMYASEKDD